MLKALSWEACAQRELRICSRHIGTLHVHNWVVSPQATAKLIARFKDGSRFDSQTVAYKNCYTAPPSLTTALISAPGATTESFASPVNFKPKMKHYCVPFTEDVEFYAHLDAISSIWQGSCWCHYCNPEPSAKDPATGSRMHQHPD